MLNFDIGPEWYAPTWHEMGRPIRLRSTVVEVLARVVVCVVLVAGFLVVGS